MKRIVKKPEPSVFRNWKQNGKPKNWKRFHRTTPIKKIVQTSLLDEQGHICCFCECQVSTGGCHIAHFRDKFCNPSLALDYNNLHISCQETPKGIPNTCGHAQKNAVLPISPLDADCEDRFLYTANGKIHPRKADDKDAYATISILNLNTKRLVEFRKQAFQEVLRKRTIQTPSDFLRWINMELALVGGHYVEFWTVKQYVSTMQLYTTP